MNDTQTHEMEQIAEPQERPLWIRFLLETVQTLVLALILYLLIDSVVARVRVEKVSMLPTVHPGEFVLVNKLAYRFGEIEHGDIVVFHYPMDPNDDYIKRVIGVPGDVVEIKDGVVWVNDTAWDEPYISSPPAYSGSWTVPENSLFVLGDNRNQSSDSHTWGFVPTSNIVGKAIAVYWPFDQIKTFTHPQTASAAN